MENGALGCGHSVGVCQERAEKELTVEVLERRNKKLWNKTMSRSGHRPKPLEDEEERENTTQQHTQQFARETDIDENR